MLSDLGGGVNGHDVNLCDKCGVCDDVTGWMGRRGRNAHPLCTDVGGAYGGQWASDGVRVTRQTTYTPTLLGSAGGPYIMHSASDTIGPGGWGQRPRRECALQVWCV